MAENADRESAVRESEARLHAEEPGRIAVVLLSRLARIEKIFVRNSDALHRHLARGNDPETALPLWDVSDPAALEEHLDETERHLFNYLAAVHSRVEHVRTFVRSHWEPDSEFLALYEDRVREEFASSSLHKWLIDLRNYLLHERLPVSSANLTMSEAEGMSTTVFLHADDLLASKGWSPEARLYIEEHAPEIDLGRATSQYTGRAERFDRWIAEEFLRVHLDHVEAYVAAQRAHYQLLLRMGLIEPHQTRPPA